MTESKPTKPRIASLDGLRGLSIWAVMLAHASSHFADSPLHSRLTHTILATSAYFGVTVFFVISGFLITMLLLRERDQTGGVSLKAFYRRRAVRILPASLVYITVILLLGDATRAQALYAFTFTTSFFYKQAYIPLQQLWSLSVEEQFYLLWPLLFMLGTRRAKLGCWTVMLACPILRLILVHHGYTESSHLAPAIDDSLAAGCLLALYREQLRRFAVLYLVPTANFNALCLFTLAVAFLVYEKDLVLLWGLAPCLVALVMIAAIERADMILNKGPLVWSGLLSYSLYLWQQPFLVFDGPFNSLFPRLLFTFAAAYLSYKFIEQPVLKHFSRKPKPMPTLHAANTPTVQ